MNSNAKPKIPMAFQFVRNPVVSLGRQIRSGVTARGGTISQEGSIASKKSTKKHKRSPRKRSLKSGKRNTKKKVSKRR